MDKLTERFNEFRDMLVNSPLKAILPSDDTHAVVEMLRAVRGGLEPVDLPKALAAQGIDPVSFHQVWALDYARKTLSYHDNPGTAFEGTLRTRCETCLSTATQYAFGNFLGDNIRQMIQEKLDKLPPTFTKPEAMHLVA